MKWVNGNTSAHLKVDLKTYNFTIKHTMEYWDAFFKSSVR
jgi:cyclopropane fatty-acyl-phospholipid synthase-like methyltransferase